MAKRKALPDLDTQLTDATATFCKDIDQLKIVLESINREGGFGLLTQDWPAEDTRRFCQGIMNVGAIFSHQGQSLLQAFNRS